MKFTLKKLDFKLKNFKVFYVLLPLLGVFSLCITIGFIIGSHTNKSVLPKAKNQSLLSPAIKNSNNKFSEVLQCLERSYVSDIDIVKLTDCVLKDMLESIDPCSTYIDSKSIVKNIDEHSNGTGIGLEFHMSKNIAQVIAPLSGSSAEWSGLRPLDIIVAIDNESLIGKSLTDVDIDNKINGPEGSKLSLTIRRKGEEDDQNLIITRSNVYNQGVMSFMVSDNIGYIKFACFSHNISREIASAINNLVKFGMQNLILDLRNNPGGEIDEATSEAVNIADLFLTKGQLILSIKARAEAYNNSTYAKSKDEFLGLKILVLVNSGTAGAAEILAGALQDNDRALLLGQCRTFGKGIIRNVITLQDGSLLKISAAKMYTPSGRSIQRTASNLFFPIEKNTKSDKYTNTGYFKADSIITDEPIYHTANGRTVLGGGGIVPDFIVTPDTDYRPIFIDKIKHIIKRIAEDHAAQYITSLSKKGENDFIKSFDIQNIIIDQVKSRAEEEGFICDESVFRGLKSIIKAEIKMYIAQYIWKDIGYFRAKVAHDPFVLKAIGMFSEYDILLPVSKETT